MVSSSQNNTVAGVAGPSAAFGLYNNMNFAIVQALAKMQTATLVQVVSCTNSGGVSPVGYVDVVPLVNQTDTDGNAIPHTTLHNLPYTRIQGGTNAVIIDPVAGDIGIAVFASRDISKVKTTRKAGNPGSLRSHNFADGMYIGGVLNGAPSQYVQFTASGITVHSPNTVTIDAPSCNFTGTVHATGNITSDSDVLAQSVSLHNHTHGGVMPGGGNTGAPT